MFIGNLRLYCLFIVVCWCNMFAEWTETDILPRLITKYRSWMKRNQGGTLKRFLDCHCNRNSSRDPKHCKIDDDDDDDDDDLHHDDAYVGVYQ